MLDKLFALGRAMRYGEELSNSATWKNRQLAANAVAGLIGTTLVFAPMEVNIEDLQTVAGAVAILGGLFNAWATASTSKKIGVPAMGANSDHSGDDGG